MVSRKPRLKHVCPPIHKSYVYQIHKEKDHIVQVDILFGKTTTATAKRSVLQIEVEVWWSKCLLGAHPVRKSKP